MTGISKIDYKPGQDNVQLLGLDIHKPVFFVSSLTIIAFVAGVLAFQAEATAAFVTLRAGPSARWAFSPWWAAVRPVKSRRVRPFPIVLAASWLL